MIAAIHQPVYLPWQPYFSKIARSDVFILLDDVQYPGGKGFFNRNSIKGAGGAVTLTAPVKGRVDRPTVREIVVDETQPWQAKHWKSIQLSYAKAPYFELYRQSLAEIYMERRWRHLCDLNSALIRCCSRLLGLATRFVAASDVAVASCDGTQRLIDLVRAVGADRYLTGAGAGSLRYMDEAQFARAGISVLWHAHEPLPYPQLWGAFAPDLCILDLLFNCGPKSAQILMDSSRESPHAA